MDRQEIVSALTKIISDYLKEQGLSLVDIIYRYEGRGLFLRLLVDKAEGGISLDECARLNAQIGKILDEKDTLRMRYILEVSSPGIDRPLMGRSDFLRCINRRVRFYLLQSINGKLELEGVIKKIEDDSVYVDINGNVIEVALVKINKAKQVLENI